MPVCTVLYSTVLHDFSEPSFVCNRNSLQYFGARTSTTLFETDELMERLCDNLRIDELGCCRVLRHARFGSHAFSGALFTDAPATSPLLEELTRRHGGNSSSESN